MNTKYRIVVTKLETWVQNIARTTEAKKRHRVKRAFVRMQQNVQVSKIKKEQKTRLVCLHFENKIGVMVAAI